MRVVNLEVVVTDGKIRVQGLTSDDFRLSVDGREVPIEYFTEVVGGTASGTPTSGATTVPALAPGVPVTTRYLVFIDDSFSVRSRRNRVLRSLNDQLAYLGPEDQMAVVAFDGREIELLSSWTSSQRELERVFRNAQDRNAYGLKRRLGSDFFYGSPTASLTGLGVSATGPAPRGSYAFFETEKVIDAATSTLRGFARPPGRKVMLFLAGDWPSTSGRYGGTLATSLSGIDRSLLRPLVDTANRLGYTLYPIDVQGIRSRGGGAEHATLQSARIARARDDRRDWLESSTLLHLAHETGGRAFLDRANITALQRTFEDTRSYYWIGFTPNWKEDDRRHRVDVDVLRKGLDVRSRGSFSDLSIETEVSMLVESAQIFELPVAGESSGMTVSFGEPSKGGFRKVIVPMRLEVPFEEITMLPTAEGHAARLVVRVAVTDDLGNRADMPVIPVLLQQEAPPEPDELVPIEIGLKLRRRPHKLLISVHDQASGNLVSERATLSF